MEEKKCIRPFNTRCSPQRMKELGEFVNRDAELRRRVEDIGFGKLLNIRGTKMPRDLCFEVIRAYDGPSKQLVMRGKKVKISPEDVEALMGVRSKGLKVEPKGSEEVFEDLKKKYGTLTYGAIYERMKKKDDNFDFYFVLYTLGTFLCPTGSALVSDKLLKVMGCTHKKWGQFDWATYVLEDVSSQVEKFVKEGKKGKASESKTLGGCIYFLWLFFLEHFGLEDKVEDPNNALNHWTDEAISNRVDLEKRSRFGLLFSAPKDAAKPSSDLALPALHDPELKDIYLRFTGEMKAKMEATMGQLQESLAKELIQLQQKRAMKGGDEGKSTEEKEGDVEAEGKKNKVDNEKGKGKMDVEGVEGNPPTQMRQGMKLKRRAGRNVSDGADATVVDVETQTTEPDMLTRE